MSLDPALRARIESLLAANPVVLFMKGSPDAPQCGFSAKAVAALAATGAEYAHVDVLADPEIREGIKAYGDWPTIPQLYIGGELVGGSDIIVQMAGSGELHVDGQVHRFGPATTMVLPRGRLHQIINTGDQAVEILGVFGGTPVGTWLPDGSALALPWRS